MFCNCNKLKLRLARVESQINILKEVLSAQGLRTEVVWNCRQSDDIPKKLEALYSYLGVEFVITPQTSSIKKIRVTK